MKIKKKTNRNKARGNREAGRHIAQFKVNGCTDRIQVGVGQIKLAAFIFCKQRRTTEDTTPILKRNEAQNSAVAIRRPKWKMIKRSNPDAFHLAAVAQTAVKTPQKQPLPPPTTSLSVTLVPHDSQHSCVKSLFRFLLFQK